MVITVFGLGFVGLTTAIGFAETGVTVYGCDINQERCAMIAAGRLPFHEPGLDEALCRNLGKTFFLMEDLRQAVKQSDCVYFCVGTPYGKGGKADLTHLFSAIDMAVPVLNDGKYRVLVTKSTIPPSTTKERIVSYVESKGLRVGVDVGVANNPEFLREGHCWDDFMNADRIVLGVQDTQTENMLRALYAGFSIPIYAVSWNTSEFIKYLSNTLLATMISYSNEMAEAADVIGDIEIAKAFRILHMDKRWGNCDMTSYVYPGCGYGGYCLPKDTNAFYALAKDKGMELGILGNVIHTNDHISQTVAHRIEKRVVPEQHIAILGLSFKPGSDDVRDSPSARVIRQLIADGYGNIAAYDPLAEVQFRAQYPDLEITYCDSMEAVLAGADLAVILTAWEEFRALSERGMGAVLDCRYML